MSKPFTVEFHTFVCPVCGSTDLVGDIALSAAQKPDGTWEIQYPAGFDTDDLTFAMTNVNNAVKCNNPYCGKTYDSQGNEVPQHILERPLHHWFEHYDIPLDADDPESQKLFAEQYKDLFNEYESWLDGLFHVPWEGVIGDCQKLE